MVMQTKGVNYYTPGWNNGTYIPPAPNPMGGYTAPQYVPQPTIPQPAQPFVAPNQIRPVNGRVVSSENDITPNDVPMDNTVSLFPTDDYSCIYAKQWTSDGKIKTTKFVPVDDGDDYVPTTNFEEEMRQELSGIKTDIQKLLSRSNSYHKKYRGQTDNKQTTQEA